MLRQLWAEKYILEQSYIKLHRFFVKIIFYHGTIFPQVLVEIEKHPRIPAVYKCNTFRIVICLPKTVTVTVTVYFTTKTMLDFYQAENKEKENATFYGFYQPLLHIAFTIGFYSCNFFFWLVINFFENAICSSRCSPLFTELRYIYYYYILEDCSISGFILHTSSQI